MNERSTRRQRASLQRQVLDDALELPVAMAPLRERRLETAMDLLERVRREEQDVRVALQIVDRAALPEFGRPHASRLQAVGPHAGPLLTRCEKSVW